MYIARFCRTSQTHWEQGSKSVDSSITKFKMYIQCIKSQHTVWDETSKINPAPSQFANHWNQTRILSYILQSTDPTARQLTDTWLYNNYWNISEDFVTRSTDTDILQCSKASTDEWHEVCGPHQLSHAGACWDNLSCCQSSITHTLSLSNSIRPHTGLRLPINNCHKNSGNVISLQSYNTGINANICWNAILQKPHIHTQSHNTARQTHTADRKNRILKTVAHIIPIQKG